MLSKIKEISSVLFNVCQVLALMVLVLFATDMFMQYSIFPRVNTWKEARVQEQVLELRAAGEHDRAFCLEYPSKCTKDGRYVPPFPLSRGYFSSVDTTEEAWGLDLKQ